MSTIVLLAMLCTKPLTMKNAEVDAKIVSEHCSVVPKAFTSDHKQCAAIMEAFKKTTAMLPMPGYYVCNSETGEDPEMVITPVPYYVKGSRT